MKKNLFDKKNNFEEFSNSNLNLFTDQSLYEPLFDQNLKINEQADLNINNFFTLNETVTPPSPLNLIEKILLEP